MGLRHQKIILEMIEIAKSKMAAIRQTKVQHQCCKMPITYLININSAEVLASDIYSNKVHRN